MNMMTSAAAIAAATPVQAFSLKTEDPIFSAIEAHRSVANAYTAACAENCRLEEELPQDQRRSMVCGYEARIVESDDPRWIANENAVASLSDEMDQAACDMLDVVPTTIEGVRALLSYAAAVERGDESGGAWPDDLRDEEIVKPRIGGHPWWFFMANNLANALAQIEARAH